MSLPSNLTPASGASEKGKQAHPLFTTAGTKRTTSEEVSVSKKIRIDRCGSAPGWNIAVGASENNLSNHLKAKRPHESTTSNSSGGGGAATFKSETSGGYIVDCDAPNESAKTVTLNAAAPSTNNDELFVIRNLDTNLTDMVPSSPLHPGELTDEYVLFASDVMDYGDNDAFSVASKTLLDPPAHSTPETALSSKTSLSTFTRKDVSVTAVPNSADSVDSSKRSSSSVLPPETTADEIELVLLPAVQQPKSASLTATTTASSVAGIKEASVTPKVSGSGITRVTTVSSASGLVRHNATVNFTRITSASSGTSTSTTSSGTSAAALLNRVNIQTALKSQPLIVTTKAQQTTAKVSIGNTTISVPLLKPLNSSQLLQSGGSGSLVGELKGGKTHSTGGTQLNLSKILNVKRGQKLNQPTFVSLSQLQIKPVVSTAKIVQAKVFKKMPGQLPPVTLAAGSCLTPASAATLDHNVIASMEKKNSSSGGGGGGCGNGSGGRDLPSVQKVYPKITQLHVLPDMPLPSALLEDETSRSDSGTPSDQLDAVADALADTASAGSSGESVQKLLLTKTGTLSTESVTSIGEDAPLKGSVSGDSSEESLTSTATVKKILATANASRAPPLLTPLSKHTEQQFGANVGPVVSIIKQTTTTASAPQSTLSSNASESSSLQLSFSNAAKTTTSAPLIAIPRNISLMMSKSSHSAVSHQQQQVKLPLTASASAGIVSSATEALSKKINISLSSTLNITAVSVAQAHSRTPPTLDSSATLSALKQSAKQSAPMDASASSDAAAQPRKLLKMASGTITTLGHPLVKRSKSTDEGGVGGNGVQDHHTHHYQEATHQVFQTRIINAKRHSLEILTKKRSGSTDDQQPQGDCIGGTGNDVTPPHTISKPETETHNVLLKQLLQNSSVTHSSATSQMHTITSSAGATSVSVSSSSGSALTSVSSKSQTPVCSQVMSGRKVINVRAPSLGLVSSLEAQLARPVIPPVSTQSAGGSASSAQSQQQQQHLPHDSQSKPSKHGAASAHDNNANKLATSSLASSLPPVAKTMESGDMETLLTPQMGSGGAVATASKTSKPTVQLISKETSFVSNPSLNPFVTGEQQQQQEPPKELLVLSRSATPVSAAGGGTKARDTPTPPTAATASGATVIAKELSNTGQSTLEPERNAETDAANNNNSGNNTTTNSSGSVPGARSVNVGAQITTIQTLLNTTRSEQAAVLTAVGVASGSASGAAAHFEKTPSNSSASANNNVTASVSANSLSIKLNLPAQTQYISAPPYYSSSSVGGQESSLPDVSATQAQQHQQQQQQQQLQHNLHSYTKNPQKAATPAAGETSAGGVNNAATGTGVAASAATPVGPALTKAQLAANSVAEKREAAAKEAELRKKRKREYQKQRRQQLNSSKEAAASAVAAAAAAAAASNSASASSMASAQVQSSQAVSTLSGPAYPKKRARKASKIEEDYDGFIDNLMTHVRQMQPLQVLEPQLSRNFGICGMYGRRNGALASNKELAYDSNGQPRFLIGEYGDARRAIAAARLLYDDLRPADLERSDDAKLAIIQNDFYDQEFAPIAERSEQQILARLVSSVRERCTAAMADVVLDIITNKSEEGAQEVNQTKLNTLAQIDYPGLTLLNNASNQCHGRMSPVVPHIDGASLKVKRMVLPLCTVLEEAAGVWDAKPALTPINVDQSKRSPDAQMDIKTGIKRERNGLGSVKTVILSLPSSAADNIISVLKDLANLLHIAPPTTYKVIDAASALRPLTPHRPERLRTRARGLHLQQILNGRRMICRHCGQVIGAVGFRVRRSAIISAEAEGDALATLLAVAQAPAPFLNFCSKPCCVQYKANQKPSQAAAAEAERSRFHAVKSEGVEQLQQPSQLSSSGAVGIESGQNSSKAGSKMGAAKCRVKYFSGNCFQTTIGAHNRRPSERELTELLFKMDITMTARSDAAAGDGGGGGPSRLIVDLRQCVFCGQRGDGLADGSSRLLNFEVDKWVHLNCALWSNGVYETLGGGLMHFQTALQMGLQQSCSVCQQLGATVKCFKSRCSAIFHLPCAVREQCVFYKNKTIHCLAHAARTEKEHELPTLAVQRRVYVERDECRQVAAVMHHAELSTLLRVGSLTFLNVGQLLPHQLDAFHTSNHIYPIGYKIIRFYWSMRRPNKRCRYICSIADVAGRPEFRIQVQDPPESEIELRDSSPRAVWQRILEPIAALRKEHKLVQLYPQFLSGEDLFGLTEPSIVRIIESLPGVETLTNYRFKYGRNPLLELPLAINPTGAARAEPKQRQLLGWRKPHTQRTGSTYNQRMVNTVSAVVAGEVTCPYSKQFVHSKSSQYKKMKQEWRNNVFLARSKIQGLGLYAARDMEKHTMIIEYIGEVIRTEVSEIREKQYEAKNRGIYMFRFDEERVVDATLSGGLARYINHSCNPNCVTETVEVDRELRIIIFAKRRINRGEELSYDYKFEFEDDANKIPCMCMAPNCRKWMN